MQILFCTSISNSGNLRGDQTELITNLSPCVPAKCDGGWRTDHRLIWHSRFDTSSHSLVWKMATPTFRGYGYWLYTWNLKLWKKGDQQVIRGGVPQEIRNPPIGSSGSCSRSPRRSPRRSHYFAASNFHFCSWDSRDRWEQKYPENKEGGILPCVFSWLSYRTYVSFENRRF